MFRWGDTPKRHEASRPTKNRWQDLKTMLPEACLPESPFGGANVGNMNDDQGFHPDC